MDWGFLARGVVIGFSIAVYGAVVGFGLTAISSAVAGATAGQLRWVNIGAGGVIIAFGALALLSLR